MQLYVKWLSVSFALLLLMVAMATVSIQAAPLPADYQQPPEPVRTIFSPQKNFSIVIESQEKHARLKLLSSSNDSVALWTKLLPHQIGPRYGFVSESGTVVLLDEWLNVFSPFAITVFDVNGEELVTYSTDEVASELKISRRQLAQTAKVGPWMRGRPFISDDGKDVVIPMGESKLFVNMVDGSLKHVVSG